MMVFPAVTMLGQYCDASNSNDRVHITSVEFGDIDNSTAHMPYSDYTDLSTMLVVGEPKELIVNTNRNNWTPNALGVWIDWNDDKNFEEGEKVLHSYDVEGPYTAMVTPPNGTVLNASLRMRVRLSYGNESRIIPCGPVTDTQDRGEVEDYTVMVSSVLSIADLELRSNELYAYPIPFSSNFTVNVSKFNGSKVNVSVFDTKGKLVDTRKINESPREITLSGNYQSSGYYFVIIESGGTREILKVLRG